MGNVLCRIGIHRWTHQRNPENGAAYLEWSRCLKEKDTLTITDTFGGS